VAKDVARISPIRLRTSQSVRLQRRFPRAVYKEDLGQLVLPMSLSGTRASRVDPAEFLVAVLQELVPAEMAAAG